MKLLQQKLAQAMNSLSSKQSFNEKKYYYTDVYPLKTVSLPEPIDLWNVNPLYGKVDLNFDFIVPKQEMMEAVDGGEPGLEALSFVARAFNDLKLEIHQRRITEKLKNSGTIIECIPKKAWVSNDPMAKALKETHYKLFSDIFIKDSNNNMTNKSTVPADEITTLETFIKYFFNYIREIQGSIPITQVGILSSKYSTPLSSGLCVEIHNGAYDKDEEKHSDFINDPNFVFWRNTAKEFGFLIDRNVPWRLVANLASPVMLGYIKESLESLVTQQHENTLAEDSNLVEPPWFFPDPENGRTEWDSRKEWIESNTQGGEVLINEEKEKELQQMIAGISLTLESVFDTFFNVVKEGSAYEMRKQIYEYYASYVFANPYIRVPTAVHCFTTPFKTNYKIINREPFHWISANKQYGDLFWLKFYFLVRSYESNITWDTIQEKRHIKKIFALKKSFDFERAIDYINKEINRKSPFLSATGKIGNLIGRNE